MILPLMGVADIQRIRDALSSAGYTTEGLEHKLGEGVTARCGLIHPDTALSLAEDGEPFSVLVRLFLAGTTESPHAVRRALEPLDPATALECGLLVRTSKGISAGMHLHPYHGWWILGDLSPHRTGHAMRPDHVLCVGPASVNLVSSVMRDPVGSALDLGTGGGVQALHLSQHAARVTATDLSPRALRFAATTAALNGLQWELLAGDMTAPVAGRRFDLVVSNPPYVLSPGQSDFLYRDSGRPGDAISAELVAAAPRLLRDGGFLQTMASWAHIHGEDWTDRVAGWLPGGLDAWVVQTSLTDIESYVEHWAGETGAGDTRRKALWLQWLASHKIEAVGTGLITVRHSGSAQPIRRLETLYQEVDPPLGAHVEPWFDRMDWLGRNDVLDSAFTIVDGLHLWQGAERDPAGWALRQQTLTMHSGLRWQESVDQLAVSVIDACHGDRPLREVLRELAEQEGADVEHVFTAARQRLPRLVERGILIPVLP